MPQHQKKEGLISPKDILILFHRRNLSKLTSL